MNRIDPKVGGFPAYLPTDYVFLQAAIKEALAGSMKLFGESFIIDGITIDLVNGRCTGGVLVFKGEVLVVDEISGTAFNDYIAISNKVWVIHEFVDPTIGQITYADGQAKATHMIRRAKVIGMSQVVSGQDFVPEAQMLRYKTESNLALGFGQFGPNILPLGSFVGFVRESNVVRLHGVLTVQANATIVGPGLLFTLPSGFVPQQDQEYIVGATLTGELFARIRIRGTNNVQPGRVEVLNTLFGGNTLTLDSIIFRLP